MHQHQATTGTILSDPIAPAALAALGYEVTPKVHLMPDAETMAASQIATYLVGSNSKQFQETSSTLLAALKSGEIYETAPKHPLVVAIIGIQNLMVLLNWRRCIHGMPHVVQMRRSGVFRAIPPTTSMQASDITPHLLGATTEMHSLDHAAAAITVGHGLTAITARGCLLTERGASTASSQLAVVAMKFEKDKTSSSTTKIGEHAPGEHPFLYALAAIRNLRDLQTLVNKTDPVVHQHGSNGKQSLVSKSILEAPASAPAAIKRFREHAFRHTK